MAVPPSSASVPIDVAAAIGEAFADEQWDWPGIDAATAALAATHADDRLAAHGLLTALTAHDRAQAVLRFRRDAGWTPTLVRVRVLARDALGRAGQIVATACDVGAIGARADGAGPPRTAQLEERIAAAQKLESLGLLAGGIAHDFNNLLMAVLAETTVAKDDPNLAPEARESLDQIEIAAQRMAELTKQLLAYAGRGRFVVERLDPDGLVHELAALLRRSIRKDGRLAVAVAEGRPVVVEADPSQLRQVVMNLVLNASDALHPEGGTIAVRSWTERPTGANAAAWVLEVNDDGVGMDAATQARIFDPFFTTKTSGHGLGLSAVVGIVHRIGGSIDVASSPGQGAQFVVRIPLCEAPLTAPRRAATNATVLSGKRVLVADDEEAVRLSMRRLLEHRGAQVIEAVDGKAARAAIHADRFDLLFLDVNMPSAGGYDLLPDARTRHPGAPVVLMSGYSESFTAKPGAMSQDGDCFLQKPFTLAEFDAALQQLRL